MLAMVRNHALSMRPVREDRDSSQAIPRLAASAARPRRRSSTLESC